MTDPFKTKTRSQLKPKKAFTYYILRRVNVHWEISNGLVRFQAPSVPELIATITRWEAEHAEELRKIKASRPVAAGPSRRAQPKPSKQKRKTPPKSRQKQKL